MSRWKKIVLAIAALLVVLVVALVVLAKLLITPERVRETLLPVARDALKRDVSVESIDISLFSGITLDKLDIARRSGEGSFVAAQQVVFRYSLPALLMLQVKIDEMALVAPRIVIERSADGRFNFSDLTETGPAKDKGAAAGQPATAAAPIDLQVSQITIRDGSLLFIDRQQPADRQRHEVTAFNLAIRDVSPGRPFPLEMSAAWNGNSLGLAGTVDPAMPGGDLSVSFNRIKVAVRGGLEADGKQLRAELQLAETPLADIMASIPRGYADDLAAMKTRGAIALTAKLAGPLDRPEALLQSATLKLVGAGAPAAHLVPALSGSIDIAGSRLTSRNLVVDVDGQKLDVSLDVDPFSTLPLRGTFELTAASLDADRLVPPSAPAAEASRGGGTTAAAEGEIGPYDIPVDVSGRIRIGRLVYQGLPLNDVVMQLSLRNNVFRLQNLSAGVSGGTLRKSATVNLGVKGLTYSADIDAKGLQGEEFLKIFRPEMVGSASGLFGAEMSFSGAGTLPETVKRKLTGNGTVRIADGSMQSIPMLDAAAALLDVRRLQQIDVEDGNIRFTVQNGQVQLDGRTRGPQARTTLNGQVGLDGSLNLKSKLSLSPELGGRLHQQGKLARYLGDEQGWTTVPLRVKGSYESPDVGLDSRELREQAKKKATQELQRSLEKKILKQDPGDTSEDDPGKKLLKDTLRGLLGN